MIPGQRSADGALYITETAPDTTSVVVNGIAMTSQGVVHVTSGALPQAFLGGIGMLNTGALCVFPGGTAVNSVMGLPLTADGRLVVQLNQPVSTGDAFVAGQRVGPLGGAYVIDTDPPLITTGFSTGFNEGF